jgi:hypothetical protein
VLSLQPSRRCNFQFPSAFAPSTEAVGSSAEFHRLLPLLLNGASLPTSLGLLSSAWPRMDLRLGLKAVVLLSRRRNSNCYRTSHRPATPRMSFPTSFESRIPRLTPRGPISDFRRTFHLPARQEMLFPIRYLLPTDVNVGLRRLWTQVQNLTKLWILCLYSRIPEKYISSTRYTCAQCRNAAVAV